MENSQTHMRCPRTLDIVQTFARFLNLNWTLWGIMDHNLHQGTNYGHSGSCVVIAQCKHTLWNPTPCFTVPPDQLCPPSLARIGAMLAADSLTMWVVTLTACIGCAFWHVCHTSKGSTFVLPTLEGSVSGALTFLAVSNQFL